MQTHEATRNRIGYLRAKLEAARELYESREITRAEFFRHEVDRSLGRDTGPIVLRKRP